MLQVSGQNCIAILLERLRAYFGDNLEYYVLCWNDHVGDQIIEDLKQPYLKVFRSGASSTAAALYSFWSAHPELDGALFFLANSVLTDCELAGRMLARHIQAGADICLALKMPLGIGPTFVMRRSAAEVFEKNFGNSRTLQELFRSLAGAMAGSNNKQLRIVDYCQESDKFPVLERLPVSALVQDEPSRLSAEIALSKYPDCYDARPAYEFKEAKIAIDVNPRAVRRKVDHGAGPRIVLFSSIRETFSGGEESLFSLITNLDRSRFCPLVIFPFEALLAEKLERRGVSIIIAGWDYTECNSSNLRFCEELLTEYKPALVHIDAFVNPALMVTAYARRIKIVGHLRIFTGPYLPPTAYLADRIITVSDAIARDVRRNNLDPKAVVRIYNGVNTNQLEFSTAEINDIRSQRGIPEDARVICMVARISAFKRLELMIEALPKILSAVPTSHVVFVGEALAEDLEYYSALRAKIENLGLERHVTWWGFEIRMGLVYGFSEIMVHCRRYEPLARCMIEALSMGLPIVGPNDGGSPEIIQDGYNGLLYEPDSAEGLSEAVIRILTNDHLRSQMAKAALAKSQEFSIERHVRGVEELYNQLLTDSTEAPGIRRANS